MIELTVTVTDHCRRVDSFLQKLLPDAPLSYRHKMISSGYLKVNGGTVSSHTQLRLGDQVALKETGKVKDFMYAPPPPIDLLYEDQWVVAINKMTGLPMHAAAEVDGSNLVDAAGKFMRRHGGDMKLRPINRLDRGTSGVVLLAKSPTAAGIFGRLVKEEGLDKLYLALVHGKVDAEGIINSPVQGKQAETRYRVLFQESGTALLALYPLTGRMHQIRQHLSQAGYPIIGDRRYGGSPLHSHAGHALHSFKTRFTHPVTAQPVTVSAPLPQHFVDLIERASGQSYLSVISSLADLQPQVSVC